jgi:endonuclease/exonuclease/phosphatase family metal-dependent hydrolase
VRLKGLKPGPIAAVCAVVLSLWLVTSPTLTIAADQGVRNRIVVMTYNIRHGCGRVFFGDTSSQFFRNCRKHIEEIVAAIRSAKPDIVGLQEVDEGLVDDIANGTGLKAAFRPHNIAGYGAWWGNAVLTHFPIGKVSIFPIGGIPGKNRSALVVDLSVDEKAVTVVNVHTQNRQADAGAIEALVHHLGRNSRPRVVVGDFNMGPDDSRLGALRLLGFADSADAALQGAFLGTYDTKLGRRIDYIFVDSVRFAVMRAGLLAEAHQAASDHIGYVAELEWR